jgi:hypothetical protein
MGRRSSWIIQAPDMRLGLEVDAAHREYLKLHPLSTAPVFPETPPQTSLTLVHSHVRDEREEVAA